jgi:uncharacterized protein YebE (UPF0316 family)
LAISDASASTVSRWAVSAMAMVFFCNCSVIYAIHYIVTFTGFCYVCENDNIDKNILGVVSLGIVHPNYSPGQNVFDDDLIHFHS